MATNMNNVLTESLDLKCSGLPSVEECEKQVPEIMTNVVKVMEKDVQFNTTMIVPFIQLIKRLDEQLTLQ